MCYLFLPSCFRSLRKLQKIVFPNLGPVMQQWSGDSGEHRTAPEPSLLPQRKWSSLQRRPLLISLLHKLYHKRISLRMYLQINNEMLTNSKLVLVKPIAIRSHLISSMEVTCVQLNAMFSQYKYIHSRNDSLLENILKQTAL